MAAAVANSNIAVLASARMGGSQDAAHDIVDRSQALLAWLNTHSGDADPNKAQYALLAVAHAGSDDPNDLIARATELLGLM